MKIGLEIKKLNNLIGKEICYRTTQDKGFDGITQMHNRIVGYIGHEIEKGREVYQRDIEKEFMISGPSVSGILKLMEKNNLIKRSTAKSDGRLKKIELTEKTKKMRAAFGKQLDEFETHLASVLTSSELTEFEKVLDKLKTELMNMQERRQYDKKNS